MVMIRSKRKTIIIPASVTKSPVQPPLSKHSEMSATVAVRPRRRIILCSESLEQEL